MFKTHVSLSIRVASLCGIRRVNNYFSNYLRIIFQLSVQIYAIYVSTVMKHVYCKIWVKSLGG